ncbi:transglutaminase domain-containing protein [Candidatus Woesearchaeota archaeon]|nr:transglutaminase domain-containing protein [Candidatus Woesearchaeota archaeon]
MKTKNIWVPVNEKYLPEISKGRKELNSALKKLYSLKLESDFRSLEKIVGGEEVSLGKLNAIAKRVQDARYTEGAFSLYGYRTKETDKKTKQVNAVGIGLENALKKLSGIKYSELEEIQKDMKKNKHNFSILSSLRNSANEIDDLLFGDGTKKGVYELDNRSASGLTQNYHEQRELIKEVDEKIKLIKESYVDFDFNFDYKKELKGLKKETRNGFLFKGDIIKKCKKAKYYEGLIKLKWFNSEIKDVLLYPGTYLEDKESITLDISEIEKLQKDLSVLGVDELKDVREKYAIDKYEDEDSFYLEQDVIKYDDVVAPLHAKVNRLLKKELKELNEDYKKLKYSKVSEKKKKGLKGLAAKFDAVGDKNGKQKAVGLAKKTGEKLDEMCRAEDMDFKYPISDKVLYRARNNMVYDVRDFIQPDNPILKGVVEKEGLDSSSLDEIAYNCMKWVQRNIKYTPDPQFTEEDEEWLMPTETVQTGKGDCEDGTNLIVSLMRNAGVPAYRVKNVCGEVDEGGHSWPIYLREKDNEWVIMDWCYKPNSRKVENRGLSKNNRDYNSIDFTFNDEHSWADTAIDVDGKVASGRWKNDVINAPKVIIDESALGKMDDGNFSLPLYVNGVGLPDNFRYFGLKKILEGRNGEKNWTERFDNFCGELSNIKIESENDYMYLSKIANGIKSSIDDPDKFLDVKGAKKAYNSLDKVVKEYGVT